MLRVNQSTDPSQAKSYYSAPDYYLGNEQEMPGQWRGEGTRVLGLGGEVKRPEWDALCDNRHPETGKTLTARQRDGRTVGYDFNFHVPKSVSLLYAETRDDRILDAFRESVDATMQDVEQDAQARVRKSGKNENRNTGNLIWGEFIHFTSRPVEGMPDPHLHAHCFVQNVTFDREEGRWKAGQFRGLKADAPYYEALFHARLGHRLAELGLPVERTAKGWELSEVDKPLVQKFSRRTALIEEKARELGIENPEAKSELGARTREKKVKQLSFTELQSTWRERMSPKERAAIDLLSKRVGSRPEPTDANEAMRSVEYAISHEFERHSVVSERALLARALRHGVGKAPIDQMKEALRRADLVYGDRNGRTMVTTRGVLAEERKIVDFARRGRGADRPFARKVRSFERDWLNADQKKAVRHIVESRDRVILLRGKAGVGKSSLLAEAKEQIEASGTKVFAFAPSAEMSRGELRKNGFPEADTVARLLVDSRLQRAVAGQLIVIDEAGQVGATTMRQVFELAENSNARVLLCGDRYQHGSVERGSALRLLEDEAGVTAAEVTDIQRQSGKYKQAVKALSDGRIGEGFRRLDDLGWIIEMPGADRYRQIAADYVGAVDKGKSTLVIAPTHREGRRLTTEIRRQMRGTGTLRGEERRFRVLESANLTEAERSDPSNYVAGMDVLVFHQNAKGYQRGQHVDVRPDNPLPLDQKKHFQVYHATSLPLAAGDRIRITRNGMSLDGKHRLNNGTLWTIKSFDKGGNLVLDNGWVVSKDFGFIDHGHVVTSFSSQGKTVQQVFVAQGFESLPASSREQFYVSASRAKERVTFYTGNKQELLSAVGREEERLTATEFIHGMNFPPPEQEPLREEVREREEELNYER